MKFGRLIFIIYFLSLSSLLMAQDSLYLYTIFHGENDQDQFGVVENVGDVNGDGFEDLMVGAPGAPRNLFSDPPTRGYAKLYYGGNEFDTIPDFVFNYYGEFTTYGRTIAGKGDLNGDGYDDFAIADPTYGSLSVGKVYVFFGGSQLDTIPDLTLSLNPNVYFYTYFGFSMTMSGDINKDGYDDLVVGAPFDDWDLHGEVFIYFGGVYMDNFPNVILIYDNPLQHFGISVDFVGDINEDNIDDLLVGSEPVESDTTTFIIFGNKFNNISLQNSYILPERLRGAVTRLGDVNGDGINDFAVRNKVFLPPLHNNVLDTLTIIGNPGNNFIIRTFLPDINSDSCDEIVAFWLIGSVENVLVIFGGDSASINNAITIEDPDDKKGFGSYIASFSNLIAQNIISLIIGDKETVFYYDHGTGKVFIYNNDIIDDVGDDEGIDGTENFILSQNYPNPFNPTTTIVFDLPEKSFVSIKLYSITGEEIRTLVNEEMRAGRHPFLINVNDLSSGVYLLRMVSNKYVSAKKIILMK